MGLRSEIHNKVNYQEFWAKHFPEAASCDKDEAHVFCPFHDDTGHKSFSISLTKGVFKCFAPTCNKGGDIVLFHALKRGIDVEEATKELAKELGILASSSNVVPPISESIIISAHRQLLAHAGGLLYLQEKRGITKETAVSLQIGLSEDGERFLFPVKDKDGNFVNIKRHRFEATKKEIKSLSWRKGYGQSRIYPIEELNNDSVIIVEGEPDAATLISLGLHAVTQTAGAGTWKKEFNQLFKGKDVAIIYDIDAGGKEGAAKVSKELLTVAKSIRVVELPIKDPSNADVTDFIIKHGAGLDQIKKLINETIPITTTAALSDDPTIYDINLHQASSSRYLAKNIRFKCVVSGKDLTPYIVPKKIIVACDCSLGKPCISCPVGQSSGIYTHLLDNAQDEIIEFIGVSKSKIDILIKIKIGIPYRCNKWSWKPTGALNIEDVRLIPEIDWSDDQNKYVNRQAYYVSSGNTLETNKAYILQGKTIPNPSTQHATHVIRKATPTLDNLDQFVLTDDIRKELKVFAVTKGIDIFGRISIIHKELEKMIGIYDRSDLLMLVDLTYHSILSFKFMGRFLKRGWIQSLVIGDTRCGKSVTLESIIRHYKAGESVSGESVSFAGLVGGLHQFGTRWTLQWGKIPLLDRRLIVIDEISGMEYEDIGAMSSMRSSGIAEITKIHTEKTNARTRQIWLSNVRGIGKRIADYTHGVLAVRELIGKLEDISRFDLVLTVASDEVSLKVINKSVPLSSPQIFKSELCHNLLMWAWSRKPSDVIFTTGTEDRILQLAGAQGKKYSPSIPLVEPAEQREKLARIAVAFASRVFSTDPSGSKVIVNKAHADAAYSFLEYIYNKPSMGYDEFSRLDLGKRKITNEMMVGSYINEAISEQLLDAEYFTQTDLLLIFNEFEQKDARTIITVLLRHKAMIRVGRSGGYRKTPAFIEFLRSRAFKKYKKHHRITEPI